MIFWVFFWLILVLYFLFLYGIVEPHFGGYFCWFICFWFSAQIWLQSCDNWRVKGNASVSLQAAFAKSNRASVLRQTDCLRIFSPLVKRPYDVRHFLKRVNSKTRQILSKSWRKIGYELRKVLKKKCGYFWIKEISFARSSEPLFEFCWSQKWPQIRFKVIQKYALNFDWLDRVSTQKIRKRNRLPLRTNLYNSLASLT